MIDFSLISPYVLAITAGWLIAHIIKYLVNRLRGGASQTVRSHMFRSGGMPSAHATAAFALMTVIALIDGVDSGLFGLSLLFTLVVIHDAVRVRRSSGEQGEVVQTLLKDLKSNILPPRVAHGHTPLEVVFGSMLGAIIGLVVFFATK